MSSPARGGAAESGMTLLELLMLVLILSLAAYTFSRFMISTRQSASRQDAAGELLQRGARSIANLRAGLQGCIELVANYGDGTGDALLPLHSLVVASVAASESAVHPSPGATPGAPAPVAFSSWPTVETLSKVDMSQDSGDTAWGDEIMYVAELNPVTFTAYYTFSGGNWVAGGTTSTTSTNAEILSVSRLQFVYDYLTWDTRTAVAGSGSGLRLVEWRSEPLINYTSLSGLTDTPSTYTSNTCCPRLAAACLYLSDAGYSLAFDPANVTLTAGSGYFYPITPEADVSGGVNAALPSSIPMYSWAYLDDYDLVQSYDAKPLTDLGRVSRADGYAGGQTIAPSSYSVALNTTGQSSAISVVELQGPGSLLQVPAYADAGYTLPSDMGGPMGGAGFPAGFEVAIDGQVDSREIYMRLVLMASNAGSTGPGIFQALPENAEISVAPNPDF